MSLWVFWGRQKNSHFSSSFSESLVAVFNLLVLRHLELKLGRANECCSCRWKAVLSLMSRFTAEARHQFSFTQFKCKPPFLSFPSPRNKVKTTPIFFSFILIFFCFWHSVITLTQWADQPEALNTKFLLVSG